MAPPAPSGAVSDVRMSAGSVTDRTRERVRGRLRADGNAPVTPGERSIGREVLSVDLLEAPVAEIFPGDDGAPPPVRDNSWRVNGSWCVAARPALVGPA